ncbi:MAG: hypothetical protein RLZZ301_448 [Bacteroidota bacterium]
MKSYFFIAFLCFQFGLVAQTSSDLQLAQYYYGNGEFDKALSYYEKVYQVDPSKAIFSPYYECLLEAKAYKMAEKVLRKQINMNQQDYELRMLLGVFYEELQDDTKAKKSYDELLDELGNNPGQIIAVYQAFVSKGKMEYAKKTLDQGKKLASYYPFNFQYADYYALIGNKKEMIREYLDYLETQPGILESIEFAIASRIDLSNAMSPDFLLLKEQLLARVQKPASPLVFSDMLIWLFVQNRNFKSAAVQVIALDKRSQSDGSRVLELGHICVENQAFDVARTCFQYLIDQGPNQVHFFEAQQALLNARFIEISTQRTYQKAEIEATIADYIAALQRVGKSRVSYQLMKQLASIRAFYAQQIDTAILEVKAIMQLPGLSDMQRAEAKMLLADIEVLGGDIWEASILYMQLDNDFKFEPIGHEAKFKNARVFYYDGEFEFAQAQLDILKESTSRLIANDALQLSVMITDNYGLDSNYQAMLWFATADRMIEQQKYDSAFALFDSIQIQFPNHALADEILYKKGQAMEKRGNWTEALGYYGDVLKFHGKDILADDALFRMAELTEIQLHDPVKALELYKQLLLEYKASLYATETRKRIRLLRGDALSEEEL